ncbi:UNVERIFIED_CONTAM: hypothetical protein Sradi_1525500 [Sesamum radiatum]|uniref:Uncharacterized protein n=1 Tax=Sesamum radiatum TaxID=300843 RepID=A0AAW2U9K2_SESRA
MEDAQASKREEHGETRKEFKEETPSRKLRQNFGTRKPMFQRTNPVYIDLNVPITQALMTMDGNWPPILV